MTQQSADFAGVNLTEGPILQSNISTGGGHVSITQSTPQKDDRRAEEERKCLQAFFSVDYNTDYQRVPSHHPETCKWLLHHPEFVKWKNGKSTTLWISGNPGMGKTVLSKFLVDTFKADCATSGKVAYFFCNDQDESRRTAISLLKAIIHQCLLFMPFLVREYVIPEYHAQGERLYTSFATLWNIFTNIICDGRLGGLYCILDALDECEEESRDQLLRQISNRFSSTLGGESDRKQHVNLKLIIISRPYESIRIQLHPFAIIRLRAECEERHINRDIALYVNYKVQDLAELRGYTNPLKQKVCEALLRGADGMFLWVSLMVRILEKTHVRKVEQKLKELPKGVNEIYNRVLQEISEDSEEAVSNILKWVLFAFRPLTLKELGTACAIMPIYKSSSSIPAEELSSIEREVALCGPILKVQNDSSVHLMHQTTKEFLLQSRLTSPLICKFVVEKTVAHREIAMACVTYLSLNEMERGPLSGQSIHECYKEYETLFQEYSLLWYAAIHWYHHVHQEGERSAELWNAVRDSLSVKSKRELSFQIRQFSDYNRYTGNQSPLHILIHTDLTLFAGILLASEAVELDVKNDSGWTALHLAVKKGQEGVVRQLLEKGADVNVEIVEKGILGGGAKITALRLAAGRGVKAVSQLLLKVGVDANTGIFRRDLFEKDVTETALYSAVWKRYEAIVQQLLEKRADANAGMPSGDGLRRRQVKTALHLAVEGGQEAIVQQLLKKGADANAGMLSEGGFEGNTVQTALHLAVERGCEAIVQQLLEKGADANAGMLSWDGFGEGTVQTALHLAVEKSYEAIVQQLLEKGADANAGMLSKDQFGESTMQTALHLAVERGSEAIVQQLLEKGADVNAGILGKSGYRESTMQTALHLAVERGSEAIVQQLLEKGADANAEVLETERKGGIVILTRGTVLHLAAEKGHEAVTWRLLQNGADVNAEMVVEEEKEKEGGFKRTTRKTALDIATGEGHEAVANLILKYLTFPHPPP